MSDLDTFTQLPLQMDAQTKEISCPSSSSRTLATELAALNSLHRALQTSLPVPVNPKRSANINKLREAGNAEHRRGRHPEALKLYDLGLQMALERPPWEPQQLVREEAAGLYANRAQARMALADWPAGALDAEASVEAKRVGNSKAWWRRGKCLLEMGRRDEARDWVRKGLEMEGDEAELIALLADIQAKTNKGKEGAATA
ncbi:tetratricopeptide repeat domain-containing protein [Xylariomycetidae sp. FL0641]|nr:tetratricopeptide repeat domain-containing protein [Xylariomycetidae sp. FL0641]